MVPRGAVRGREVRENTLRELATELITDRASFRREGIGCVGAESVREAHRVAAILAMGIRELRLRVDIVPRIEVGSSTSQIRLRFQGTRDLALEHRRGEQESNPIQRIARSLRFSSTTILNRLPIDGRTGNSKKGELRKGAKGDNHAILDARLASLLRGNAGSNLERNGGVEW